MNRRPVEVCYVATYPPSREELGGSGWVDRRVLTVLAELVDDLEIVCVTGEPGSWSEQGVTARCAGGTPLQIRRKPAALARVAFGMLLTPQPYLARKFTAFRGWHRAVDLLAARAAGRLVITSGWPALLLADAASVQVAVHLAHNVESDIAAEHAPRALRLLNEHGRLWRMEARLLRRPRGLYALSARDATKLGTAGLPARVLPVPLQPKANGITRPAAVGFIGKASWPPNERALSALLGPVHERLSALGAGVADVPYVLAGVGTEIHAAHPRVTAAGPVHHLADFYRSIGLVVVPRYGTSTGISVKVLEAAEYGVASVLPSALAEAIDPEGPWLLAEDPGSTAAAIVRWRRGETTPDVLGWARSWSDGRAADLLAGALMCSG